MNEQEREMIKSDVLRKYNLKEEANRACNDGSVRQALEARFGVEKGQTLFELIGIGLKYWDELQPEHIKQD